MLAHILTTMRLLLRRRPYEVVAVHPDDGDARVVMARFRLFDDAERRRIELAGRFPEHQHRVRFTVDYRR